MKKISYIAVLAGLLAIASACRHTPSKKKAGLNPVQANQMEKALLLMKDSKFEMAALIYDDLARHVSDSRIRVFNLFNSGVAYKEAGQCEKALLRFRQLLESAPPPSFKARGLMEISFVYECLGDSEKSLLSLQDAGPLISRLPFDLRQWVYPARLSIAYAGAGNKQSAEVYKSLVLDRIAKSAPYFSDDKLEPLSRAFYIMGRFYSSGESFSHTSFLRSFAYRQLYLLQSWFLTDTAWSKSAQKELGSLLDKLAVALSESQETAGRKGALIQAINDARVLIKRENNKDLSLFYEKKVQPALKLLSS